MIVMAHFALPGFTNTYLISEKSGGEAILIDPGVMDIPLLKMIEDNGFTVKSILVTHAHEHHIKGIRTLKRIYDAQIYSSNPRLYNYSCVSIRRNETLMINGIEVHCMGLPGHSSDSIIYHIGNMLFTGDTFFAGRLGSTPNSYARANLFHNIITNICSLDPKVRIYPGHGPPSTLESELSFNTDLIPQDEFIPPKAGFPPSCEQNLRRLQDREP